MKIIISPAKKMNYETDFLSSTGKPKFVEKSHEIYKHLQAMNYDDLKKLWSCNDKIAEENFIRLKDYGFNDLCSPALFSYEGIQYKYLGAKVMENSDFAYLDEHLRIVSGLFGLLRPFDGIFPYRLEMQAKLNIGHHKNLYEFWGDSLGKEISHSDELLINLASNEYSKAILPHITQNCKILTISFMEHKGEKLVEKATMCKMMRGSFLRFLALNKITNPDEMTAFCEQGFHFSQEHSTNDKYIFIKGE